MRRVMTFGVGVVFALVMVATCGVKGGTSGNKNGSNDGSLLGDAYSGLADLAHRGVDALGLDLGGVKDAAASPPMVGDCSQANVITETSSNATFTTTTYYSEFDPAGFDPTTNPTVTVTLCNYEYFGTSTDSLNPTCSAGYTCSTSGYVPPVSSVPCLTTSYARIGAGKIVVSCGSKSEVVVPSSNTDTISGSRATKVYVSVN